MARRLLGIALVVALGGAEDVQDLYETSNVAEVPVGFADEIEIEANGRNAKLVFDGARSSLSGEARQFVDRLGIDSGAGCPGGDGFVCAAGLLEGMMETAVASRRERYGAALDAAQLRIAVTTRGHRMAVSAKDLLVSPSLDVFGRFEEPALALMLALVRTGDDVVDVGANIGAHAIPLAEKVAGPCEGAYRGDDEPRRGHLHALEPQATLHARGGVR